MTPEEYLHQLRKQLDGFSPEEQSCLLAEIASHLESGEEDSTRGEDPAARRQRVMGEMGSPEQMGDGFKQVHRPNRTLDFLIAFLPSLVIFPLIPSFVILALTAFAGPEPASTDPVIIIASQGSIFVSAILVLLSWWRRSVWLLLFWIPTTALYILTLLVSEQRWSLLPAGPATNPLESLIWVGLLAGLAFIFVRLLWKNRGNLLLFTFALLPVVMMSTRELLSLLSTAMGITYGASRTITASPEFFFLDIFATVAWMPLFFLPMNRLLRWLALVFYAIAFLMRWIYLFGFHALPVVLFSIPLLVVLLGWLSDQHREPPVVPRW